MKLNVQVFVVGGAEKILKSPSKVVLRNTSDLVLQESLYETKLVVKKKRRMNGTSQVTTTCATRQIKAASVVLARGDRFSPVVRINILCGVIAFGCGVVGKM